MGFNTARFYFLLSVFMLVNVTENAAYGRRRYDIINGHSINITEAPFFAIYRPIEGTWGCGASVVHEKFVITACHCREFFHFYETEIVVGTDKINEGIKYAIKNATCHPKRGRHDYDLAIVELENELKFSETVNKIEIADSNVEIKEGDVFETMGFGSIKEGDEPSDTLHAADVPYFDQKICEDIYMGQVNITARMICAGGKTEDPCKGDSGGPLRFKGKLIGAVGLGLGCAVPGVPRVYAFVPAMRDFIDSYIH